MTSNDCIKQGNDFLARHGIRFDADFLGKGKHFPDDKELRNRYSLKLYRERSVYSADGSATVRRAGHSVAFDFGQSIAGTKAGKRPTAYDLLACLTTYDPGTFENFCGDFGYDEDSRKALQTYLDVQAEFVKVARFFTAEELTEVQEIS